MKTYRSVAAALVLVGSFSVAGAQSPAPVAKSAQKSDSRSEAIHLLQRATFGARPQDIDQLLATGRDRWLEQQLTPSRIADGATAKRLEQFPLLEEDMGTLLKQYGEAQRERRQNQTKAGAMTDEQRQMMIDSVRRNAARNQNPEARMLNPQYVAAELVAAKLTRSVYSERQLEEVMTDFWYNHFNVYIGKGIDRFLIADYESNAIRPNVFGKFRDLLEASAKHPAMLFYLDNVTSVAADSMRAKGNDARSPLEQFKRMPARRQEEVLRRQGITREQMEKMIEQQDVQLKNRERGLNENYARELMELHTLGVDGGYTQKDVIEVARALTGWSFARPGPRGNQKVQFVFNKAMHDQGEKNVLGTRLPAGRGIEDGEAVLDLLARHPSTAQFIAGKLVERFVSDTPDPAFVAELAAVFTRTDGDLREVTRALFASPRFYAAGVQRSKVKTPFELVASAFRATGAEVGLSRATVQALRGLGHMPYGEAAPTGYGATSEDWVNSGSMLNRMNFALTLAANRLDNVKVDPRAVGLTAQVDATVAAMLSHLMPGVETSRLQQTILNELKKPETEVPEAAAMADDAMMTGDARRPNAPRRQSNAPIKDPRARALGLALGAPDFQKK